MEAIRFAASAPLAPIFSILPAAQHGWRLNLTAVNTIRDASTMFAVPAGYRVRDGGFYASGIMSLKSMKRR